MYDLVIKNGKLVSADRIYEADILVKDGKFAGFTTLENVDAKEVIDAKGKLVFPGIIDCHAHMNEPGFNYREDFETGSRAAVVAGCTTLIDMPLNNDPALLNAKIFDMKMEAISKHSLVDFALWGGIVGDYDDKPDSVKCNLGDLLDLEEKGCAAFKGFTCPNGDLFPTVNLGHVRKALEILKPTGALSGFHCEEYGQVLERGKEYRAKENRTKEEKISDFLAVHDVWIEYAATKGVIDMVRATGGRVHICHVTHPLVAQVVKDAIHEGLPVSGETCPHYLGFCDEDLYRIGAPAKCTPPLRSREEMKKLWDYVLDGTLSCIGSDHSPAADHEKDNETKDIWQAWGGLNGIQYFLPLTFDLFVNKKGLSPTWISKLMGINPAKLFGLYGKKGAFEIGFDADIVIFDPEKEWKVDQTKLLTKGHISYLHGVEGKGLPTHTIIRGKVVAQDGMYKEEAIGYGEFIPRIK